MRTQPYRRDRQLLGGDIPDQRLAEEASLRVRTLLMQMSDKQRKFATALFYSGNIAEACQATKVGINEYNGWPAAIREGLDEIVAIYYQNVLEVAASMLKNAVLKAVQVKVEGLDSENERVQQEVATEIIQHVFGRPTQKRETVAAVINVKGYVGISPEDWEEQERLERGDSKVIPGTLSVYGEEKT
jgi:ActR/RegA family two-component response regulator